MRVGDLENVGVFTSQNDGNTYGSSSSQRFRNQPLPGGSSIAMKGIGVFKKRVRDEVEQMNYQQMDKKYTYCEETSGMLSNANFRITKNLDRGDETRDQFVGRGIQPLWIKMQYKVFRAWDNTYNKTPNLSARLLFAQWTNDRNTLLITDVLQDPFVIAADANLTFLTTFKNASNMENFNILADRVKSGQPHRNITFGPASITVTAVGEIYIHGDKLNPILFPKDQVSGEYVPNKGQIVFYMRSDENPQPGVSGNPGEVFIEYIIETCYSDKI